MNNIFQKSILLLPLAVSVSFAQLTTNFAGSEGYTNGSIDDANQTGAPNFNAPSYGFYLPGGHAPDFGTLKQDPNSQAKAYTLAGSGALAVGDSWVTTMDFTYEGYDLADSGFMPTIGFVTSNSTNSDSMVISLQRTSGQATSSATAYQLYLQGGSGSYKTTNVQYSAIGDDTADANDLTDNLRFSLTITKSITANEFDAIGTLTNLDTSSVVGSLTTTFNRANAYNASDLYGYIASGNQTEANNFDITNIDAYSFVPVPEPASYALVAGCLLLGYVMVRRRK